MISEYLNNLSFTAKKYDQQKIRAINRFNAIIVHYPSHSKLAEFALDPKQKDGQRISCFILLKRGVKHSSNNRIINTCLIFFVQNLRTKISEGNGLDRSVFVTFVFIYLLFRLSCCGYRLRILYLRTNKFLSENLTP